MIVTGKLRRSLRTEQRLFAELAGLCSLCFTVEDTLKFAQSYYL